jgi:hypothetical protein
VLFAGRVVAAVSVSRGLAGCFALMGNTLALACSLLIAPSSSHQCSTDSDCAAVPALRGRVCNVEHGICVDSRASAAADGTDAPCQSTEICTQRNAGDPSLCRVPGSSACLPLTSPECPSVSGTWQAASAIFLGSIGPLSLQFPGFAEAFRDPYTARLLRAIDLGAEEWQAELPNGLGFSSRTIALVHCDSRGRRGGRHDSFASGAPAIPRAGEDGG